jgi:surface antigen
VRQLDLGPIPGVCAASYRSVMRALLSAIALATVAAGAHAQLVQPLFQNAPSTLFTAEDMRLFRDTWTRALEEGSEQQTLSWKNPANGHGGDLTLQRSFQWRGNACREVRIRNQAQGRKGDETISACKMEGLWKLVSAEQLKK